MKRIYVFALIIAITASLSSCFRIKKSAEISIGGASEILFVTQNAAQWNGEIGDTVRHYFEQQMIGFIQPEKEFKVVNIFKSEFDDMFEKYRNIVVCEIVPNLEKSTVDIKHNWKSTPQYVVTIKAATPEKWIKVFDSQKEDAKKAFRHNERQRIIDFYITKSDAKAITKFKNKFNFSLTIPEYYLIAVREDDFMWIRKEEVDKSYGLIIYQVPYVDADDLSPEKIIARTDSVTKKYIPGPAKGSYMALETEFLAPVFQEISDFPAGPAIEMRAQWKTEGDFMGGPCVSYTLVNPNTNKIVCVEGFVYYPNKAKRDMLRQLEAILWTLQF